jgi:uncharacterized protein with HEPN domain
MRPRRSSGSQGVTYSILSSRTRLLRSAVLYQLVVIGEAAARLSAELRARYSSVPWQVVVGFRNVAVHAYFSIDWSIVWTTAASDVPNLREQILRIIAGEESRKS